MKKNWISLVLIFFITMMSVGCGAKEGNQRGFKVGLVTDTGGLFDESFNENSWKGLQKAKKDMGIDIKALESKRDDDIVPNLTKFARSKTDITWGVGFKFEKAMHEVANRFPKVQFAILDSNLGHNIPKNVLAVAFKDHEGSFLMGALAGLTTKTNRVGFIGGISSPVIKRFECGYKAGVHAVNPKAVVQSVYAESFTDSTKGRSLASNMYNSGIDVIFHASGAVGKGLFDEVKTREKGKFWAIGVDMDQSNLAPDHVLSSMVKHEGEVIYKVTKDAKEGKKLGGKLLEYGLKENGMGYAKSTSKHVSSGVLKRIDELRQRIINGEIKVPATDVELTNYLRTDSSSK